MKKNILLTTLLTLAVIIGTGSLTIINDAKANTLNHPSNAEAAVGSEAAAASGDTGKSKAAASSGKDGALSAAAVSGTKAVSAFSDSGTAEDSSAVSGAKSSDGTQEESAPAGRYYISMGNILQRPELPTGCEATALAIVLNHLGFDADKCGIVDDYLPVTSEQCSLDHYFIGNPYSESGLGCNAPVIAKTADQYLSAAGGNYSAKLITGSTPDQLYQYVAKGIPVICWATIDMLDTQVSATWTAVDTGRTVDFMENEHCTVLVGYDTEKDTVTLNDPWNGITSYGRPLFEKRYRQLGNQAVILT